MKRRDQPGTMMVIENEIVDTLADVRSVSVPEPRRRVRLQVQHLVLVLVSICCIPPCPGQDAGSVVEPAGVRAPVCEAAAAASPYVPVDNWIYPQMLRLHAMGYVGQIYLDMRPWTRSSIAEMLEDANGRISDAEEAGEATAAEARDIYNAVEDELSAGAEIACAGAKGAVRLESVYSAVRALSGTPLRDSYHLGSTIVNDYGRRYENGLNNYSGAGGYAVAGRFTLYVRGEFQGVPSAAGYPASLVQVLAGPSVDQTYNPVTGLAYPNQATIPAGPLAAVAQGSLLEAYVSTEVLNHVISFGKQDDWMGPAEGASMAYSNNAENIYALHINRVEPLNIPLLSRITGPFRYEFLIGALQGHTLMPNPLYNNNPSVTGNVISPGNPWVHVEKLSFHPTENVELGFERTVIFGGEGHSPVTLHTFLKSFFSTVNVTAAEKNGPDDPGARFGAFDFSYRLPFVRNWLTLYADSEVHDDVSPIDAPRRAAIRPGLYLSHVPGLARLDVRVEGATTDPPVSRSVNGTFMYWEGIEKQGYTNQGQLFGDWIGREDKGGQAWLTYHLSGNEWIQASWRGQKAAKDFIPGGTTLDNFGFQAVKRIGKDFEVNSSFTVEHWKAPIYLPGEQTVTSTEIELTWFPERKIGF